MISYFSQLCFGWVLLRGSMHGLAHVAELDEGWQGLSAAGTPAPCSARGISSWAGSGGWISWLLWPLEWGRSYITWFLRLGLKKPFGFLFCSLRSLPRGLQALKQVNHFCSLHSSLLSCSVSSRNMGRRGQKAKYKIYLCQHRHSFLPVFSRYTPSGISDWRVFLIFLF